MKELIEKILCHFPQYMGDFGSVLASPKRFLERQKGSPQDRMSASLTFLAISTALVVIMSASRRPPGQELWADAARAAVLVILGTSLFAAALRTAWRIVGGKATTREYFLAFSYYYGVAIVVGTVFVTIGIGILKVFDRTVYDQIMSATAENRLAPSEDLMQSSGFWGMLVVWAFGLAFVFCWNLFYVWQAYRQLNGLSKARFKTLFQNRLQRQRPSERSLSVRF
jgi:hypothetical protein